MAIQLQREAPECGPCERWGRRFNERSPIDEPSCQLASLAELEDWDARAAAITETRILIETLWPGVLVRPAVSRPGRPVYSRSTVNLFAEIKRRVPIQEVAERLTELRGNGRSLSGRCPFHDDRSPSFVVWPEISGWRCYGCGAKGDTVELVRRAMEAGLWR